MSVEDAQAGSRVVFTGVTSPDPGRSLAALRAVAADLEASPHFAQVELAPPTGMPTGDGESEPLLEFAIEAVWEGGE